MTTDEFLKLIEYKRIRFYISEYDGYNATVVRLTGSGLNRRTWDIYLDFINETVTCGRNVPFKVIEIVSDYIKSKEKIGTDDLRNNFPKEFFEQLPLKTMGFEIPGMRSFILNNEYFSVDDHSTLSDITKLSREDLLSIRGIGKVFVDRLEIFLSSVGLKLRSENDDQ